MPPGLTLRALGPGDLDLLLGVGEGLFDNPVDPAQARAFLDDPLHEIVLAFDGAVAVGFASGTVLYHPDKPPSMFVNEVGVREGWQRRGIGKAVSAALFGIARARGCEGIWLGTEPDNDPARALYRSLGGEEYTFVGYGWDGAF
jgi:ribosomal protein S18 acetylase RimI-like enzyme